MSRLTTLLAALLLSSGLPGCAARSKEPNAPAAPTAPAPGHHVEHRTEPEGSAEPTASEKPSASSEVALRFPRRQAAWLGIEMVATAPEQPGVEVVEVFPGSPAEQAGLRRGDVIIRLGEEPAEAPTTIAEWTARQAIDTSHPLSILRGGEPHLVRVTLAGAPNFEDQFRLRFVGRPAPEIAGVATFQGEASSLAELKGQVVVLEFWASWCGVCQFISRDLDAWHRSFRPQGAQVIGITTDPPKVGMRVAQRLHMSYTLASDNGGKVGRRYLAREIPLVVIIDKRGIVRDAMVGYSRTRLEETEQLIAQLLEDT